MACSCPLKPPASFVAFGAMWECPACGRRYQMGFRKGYYWFPLGPEAEPAGKEEGSDGV